jgi:hypothetical protein
MLTKHTLCYKISSKIKTYPNKLKLILKNTIIDKTLTYASETSTLAKRGRKQLNIFERKVYRRILGPVYDNLKKLENINKEIYGIVKKNTITETIRLHRLCWLGHVLRKEENLIPKSSIYEFGNNKTERQTKNKMAR